MALVYAGPLKRVTRRSRYLESILRLTRFLGGLDKYVTRPLKRVTRLPRARQRQTSQPAKPVPPTGPVQPHYPAAQPVQAVYAESFRDFS